MDQPLTLQETYKHRLIDIISIYGHFKCFKVKLAIMSSRSHNNPKQIKIKKIHKSAENVKDVLHSITTKNLTNQFATLMVQCPCMDI